MVDISFTRQKHIGFITLKRAQALNALNLPMIKEIQKQLQHWQEDSNIHAVIVQAEEGKAFCAGGDVRWLYEAGLAKNPEQLQFFWHEYRLNHYIHHFKKPYITLMNGITMGGGVGISLHGSHPVATERFVFAMPETGIGFFPDIGASYLLARCPGEMGIYLGLTGNRLHAEEALSLGLIKNVVASEKLALLVEKLISSDLSFDAHQRVTDCLQEFAIPAKVVVEDEQFLAMESCFKENSVEKIMAKLEARDDALSIETKRILEQKAPLSLKVTLAQIRKAKSMSMGDCVKMDYCLVNKFMRDSDFYEGIRALLIDKDKTPHWHPERLALVLETKIADYFEDTQSELELILNA